MAPSHVLFSPLAPSDVVLASGALTSASGLPPTIADLCLDVDFIGSPSVPPQGPDGTALPTILLTTSDAVSIDANIPSSKTNAGPDPPSLSGCGSEHGEGEEPCLLAQLIQVLDSKEDRGNRVDGEVSEARRSVVEAESLVLTIEESTAVETTSASSTLPPPAAVSVSRLCPVLSGFSSPISSSSSDLPSIECVCLVGIDALEASGEEEADEPATNVEASSSVGVIANDPTRASDSAPMNDDPQMISGARPAPPPSIGQDLKPWLDESSPLSLTVTTGSGIVISGASPASSSTLTIQTNDSVLAMPGKDGKTVLVLPPGVKILCGADADVRKMSPEEELKLRSDR